jgi:hypothetical protein
MFLLLALVMQVALDASLSVEGRYRPQTTGIRLGVGSIPDCNRDLYIHNRACLTMVFTPNTSSAVQVRAWADGRGGGEGALGNSSCMAGGRPGPTAAAAVPRATPGKAT